MRWKSTLVLLAATIGIGMYVSLYELKQPTPEERAQAVKRVLGLSRETVTALDLAFPASTVTLALDGTTWRMGQERFRANEEMINGILSLASPLIAERVLTGTADHPLDLAAYGLSPPVGRITVTANGRPITLLIGETTPVESKRYVQLEGKPEVYVVPSSLFDNANRPKEEFRDPLLIRFDAWSADELTVTSASATFALSRQKDDWRLIRPLEDRAGRSEVTAVLTALGRLAIKRVVDEHPQAEAHSAWGFEQPMAEFALRLHGNPPTTVTVSVGKTLPDDGSLRYAKRSDEPALYAVAEADVQALLKNPQELRAKTCFEFFTSHVRRVEVASGGTAWTIERADGQWKDLSGGTVLDAQRVETFLAGLSDLPLTGFVEESQASGAGLESPTGVLTVWTADRTEPQRLAVGGAIPGSTERYGRLDGRPGLVQVPEQILTLLQTTPARLGVTPAPESVAAPAAPAGSPSRGSGR